jgi:hypothetical protein
MPPIALNRLCTRETLLKRSTESRRDAIHVIIPHCTNWRLTETAANAFLRLTRRPCSVTVVNNFDRMPESSPLFGVPNLSLLTYEHTLAGRALRLVHKKREGSWENAQALDGAIRHHPAFKWCMMAHSDSAPLARHWDDFFFAEMGSRRILGNVRDRIRIHAAHASGTLFDQEEWLKLNGSMRPIFRDGDMALDVGDQASVLLHDLSKEPVPVLPNTVNDPALIEALERKLPTLVEFARTGSCISFDPMAGAPIYGHMGRGTPRNLGDPNFKSRAPVDHWIELVDSIR